jgi:DUF971 family protein
VTNVLPPSSLTLNKSAQTLMLTWHDGESAEISAQQLRRYCACSSCRAARRVGMLLVTDQFAIDNIALMGNASLQIIFQDGHDRGIYPWGYLRAIAEDNADNYFDVDDSEVSDE